MRLALIPPLALVACAHDQGASQAVHGASQALVGVDLASYAALKTIADAQAIVMASCEAIEDPAALADCLGVFAEPLEPKIRRIAEAYDLAATSLVELEEQVIELERILEEARRVLKENGKCGDDC